MTAPDRLADPVRPPLRVGAALVLIAALIAALVPALRIDWGVFVNLEEPVDGHAATTVSVIESDLLGHMVSPLVLPALGLVLSLRSGVINLSLWGAYGLAQVLLAGLMISGLPGWAALLAAMAAGAATAGLAGGLIRLRAPGAIATLAAGLAAMLVARAAAPLFVEPPEGEPLRELVVPLDALLRRGLPMTSNLGIDETFLVSFGAIAVLVGLFIAYRRGREGPGVWGGLLTAGVLTAVGALVRLLDRQAGAVPTRLVGDLRLYAAPVLAGALLFRGRGRALGAAALLPAAMLAVTLWRQYTLRVGMWGYELHVLVLAAGAVVVHAAAAGAFERRGAARVPGVVALLGGLVGLGLTAATAHLPFGPPRPTVYAVGVALIALAAAELLILPRLVRSPGIRRNLGPPKRV